MTPPTDSRPPMVVATEWVARITTVALEMFLPGLAGRWLDTRLGTGYFTLVGFAIGLVGGMWHLLLMTGATSTKRKTQPPTEPNDQTRNES